jgi:hypothetical protein
MDVLQVQFRKREQQWQVRIVPRAIGMSPHEWRDWNPPAPKHLKKELLASLFCTDDSHQLCRRPWHLQLMGEQLLASSAGIPPGIDWTYLVHPSSGCHVLDLGWTVTELVVAPAPATISGKVVVVGDKLLAAELRRTVGPIVSEATADTLPEQAIVLVCGEGMNDAQAEELDEKALQQRCPLLVWHGFMPPRGFVPAIFDNGWPPPKGHAKWLARLLVRLVRGVEPTVAFADAGGSDPPEDRFLRRMRGAHEGWTISGEIPQLTLPRNWYILLDRSQQEGRLFTLVDGLASAKERRIQVVLTPGPDGSGLDLFRQRPPRYSGPRKVVEWDLGWADNPANSIQELQRRVNASQKVNIAHRLQEEAARHEGGTLFVLRHNTVSFERRLDAVQVTPDELKQYCGDLQSLAAELANTNLRLLFHISVVGTTTEQLSEFRADQRHYAATVLKTLDAGVPKEELRDWLNDHEMRFTESELDQTHGMNYDELIQWLVQRRPELVGG